MAMGKMSPQIFATSAESFHCMVKFQVGAERKNCGPIFYDTGQPTADIADQISTSHIASIQNAIRHATTKSQQGLVELSATAVAEYACLLRYIG